MLLRMKCDNQQKLFGHKNTKRCVPFNIAKMSFKDFGRSTFNNFDFVILSYDFFFYLEFDRNTIICESYRLAMEYIISERWFMECYFGNGICN